MAPRPVFRLFSARKLRNRAPPSSASAGGPGGRVGALAFLMAWILLPFADANPAGAQNQFLTFPSQLRPQSSGRGLSAKPNSGDGQMLVQADEIKYDYNNELVSAVGNVQIYYKGSTLEADKVVYNQRTKRLHAEGNARLTEPDGNVSYGELLDLSDNY